MAIRLANTKDIPEGGSIVVKLSDGREIAIFNVDGHFFALDNACPHMGGPLGEGCLEGHRVVCPWHGWEFDVRSGACENMPGVDATSLSIFIDGGCIFLTEGN